MYLAVPYYPLISSGMDGMLAFSPHPHFIVHGVCYIYLTGCNPIIRGLLRLKWLYIGVWEKGGRRDAGKQVEHLDRWGFWLILIWPDPILLLHSQHDVKWTLYCCTIGKLKFQQAWWTICKFSWCFLGSVQGVFILHFWIQCRNIKLLVLDCSKLCVLDRDLSVGFMFCF